jgi:hypothetical protein
MRVSESATPANDDAFDFRAALAKSVRGAPSDLTAYLQALEGDIEIKGARTKLHAYFLPIDANGRFRVEALAEFLCDRVVDYAIPRRVIREAEAEQARTGSTAPILRLEKQARALFTRIANSGEGGELLLFAMAEAVFGFTQILCKMSLKTSAPVHYHGADGVYAEARPDGGLNVYWGESKIYDKPAAAIRECLKSLGPFLTEPEALASMRTRDVLLVNEFANFTDERLVAGLRAAFDVRKPASLKTKHCGIALTAFDCGSYACQPEPTMEQITVAMKAELPSWLKSVGERIAKEKLASFDLHFICVPMPKAQAFRSYFLKLLGAPG